MLRRSSLHVVRTPITGIVRNIEQDGGPYPRKDASLEDSYLRGKPYPVQQIVTLETELGEVKVRLITSYWASRIKVWARIGEKVEKGQRIGRILLGSTVTTEFPESIALNVRVGEHVTGGDTDISGERATQ